MPGADIIRDIAVYAVPLLFGVIFHEVAHGWVAEKLGDPTARMLGRITLNPVPHIDPFGTVILPVVLLVTGAPFLFGWAKPVPVTFENLRGGRRDMALVSLAGPVTNLLLAAGSAVVYHAIPALFQSGFLSGGVATFLAEPIFLMARASVVFNVTLAVVNLIPVPPLDGGHVLEGILPWRWAVALSRVERYGMIIVVLVLATGLWNVIVRPFQMFFLRLFL